MGVSFYLFKFGEIWLIYLSFLLLPLLCSFNWRLLESLLFNFLRLTIFQHDIRWFVTIICFLFYLCVPIPFNSYHVGVDSVSFFFILRNLILNILYIIIFSLFNIFYILWDDIIAIFIFIFRYSVIQLHFYLHFL